MPTRYLRQTPAGGSWSAGTRYEPTDGPAAGGSVCSCLDAAAALAVVQDVAEHPGSPITY
jgi:hypothetical protein